MTKALSTRQRAAALLDVLGVGSPADRTREAVEQAQVLARCFPRAPGRSPGQLADALSRAPDDPELAARVATWTEYPPLALAWAWADPGALDDGGALDRSVNGAEGETPLGAISTWWRAATQRARERLEEAERAGDGEASAYWRGRVRAGVRPRGTLILSSSTGAGKTVAVTYLSVRHGGTFVRCAALGELGWSEEDEAVLARLAAVSLLVLDELGRESSHGPTPGRITELLATRHERGLATVITTNMLERHKNLELSFVDRYGDHLLDRVRGGGGGWVELRGTSRRGRPAAPSLTQIRRCCRIADLADAVRDATTARREGARDASAVEELRDLFEVAEVEVEAAAASRASWELEALEELRGLGSPAIADVAERLVARG